MNYDALLDRFPSARVAIIGDLMLDVYSFGTVTRISPEAPVPVGLEEKTENRLGGAGNVARNIASLGGGAYLFGVVGQDVDGIELSRLCYADKINPMVCIDKMRKTTRKLRLVAQGGHQIVRWDREDTHEIGADLEEQILDGVENIAPDVGSIVLSDYAKGVVTYGLAERVIDMARALGTYVVVDPKNTFDKYRGAALVTPNLNEFRKFGGVVGGYSDMAEHAQSLMDRYEIGAFLITLGEHGMLLIEHDAHVHIPANDGIEVTDVSGAGDTAIATVSLALASGASLHDAALLANQACGIVVRKAGTAVVGQDELRAAAKVRA